MQNEMNHAEVAERMLHSAEILSEMQMNTPVDDDIIALEDAVDVLQKVANGELVEVIRCRDCKQRKEMTSIADGIETRRFCKCKTTDREVTDNFFCGYGERKDGVK